jgi:hypothetical protein
MKKVIENMCNSLYVFHITALEIKKLVPRCSKWARGKV